MSNQLATRPFLKWAGGKYRLLDKIKPVLPTAKRLIEPFAGAAAVSLNTDYRRYWLNDLNQDLVNLYRQLQQQQQQFIHFAATFFTTQNNNERRYYQLRQHFNASNDPDERAALFLYLNRHSYNGLCRYNQQGLFNAPFGRYPKPYFPKQQLHTFAQRAKKIKFTQQTFEKVMQQATPNDVVYCDPPYIPLNKTANFTQYHQHNFTEQQQQKLADLALELAKKHVPVIISNHNTAFTRQLYKAAKLKKFTVPRSISCKGNQRKPIKELLAIYG